MFEGPSFQLIALCSSRFMIIGSTYDKVGIWDTLIVNDALI